MSTESTEGFKPVEATHIRLGVVGAGYVGLTTGACFAHLGHHVVCGDIDQRKVNMLNGGRIPIVEKGLERLVNENPRIGPYRVRPWLGGSCS